MEDKKEKINIDEKIAQVDEKLSILRIEFVGAKKSWQDMAKLRADIDKLLDERLEWMLVRKSVKKLAVRKKK